MDAKVLFRNIVNCPWAGACDACKQVLSEQDGLSCRQVPEPWSGNLKTASFMGLGANPAIDSDEYRRAKVKKLKGHTEVFPSRTQDGKRWANILPNGERWTDDSVYDFFERRFDDAKCPGTDMKYVDVDETQVSILMVVDKGHSYCKAQNTYWAWYKKYCKVINEVCAKGSESPVLGRDIVVTDIVHCKGGKEKGVKSAWPVCKKYTCDILKLFVNNHAPRHTLVIFGAKGSYSPVLKLLSEIWIPSVKEDVGEYYYKRSGVCTPKVISRQKFTDSETGKEIDVYYGVPKPSGSNSASQNIILHGVAISNNRITEKAQLHRIGETSGFVLKELKPKRQGKTKSRRCADLMAE